MKEEVHSQRVKELAKARAELEEKETELEEKDSEIENLNGQLEDMAARYDLEKEEKEKYNSLLSKLNRLLRMVYYVSGDNGNTTVGGTGFSIEYRNRVFLITAGHMVDWEGDYYPNLGFKSNFSYEWIYPELLIYNNKFLESNDYAIFYSEKVEDGFQVNTLDTSNQFILGISGLNVSKRTGTGVIFLGESGSPVINLDSEVVSMLTGSPNYTDIDIILEAIDYLIEMDLIE